MEHIEMLPSYVQLQVASLLLSAVVIDHDTQSDGILSSLLFNNIIFTFLSIQQEMQAECANKYVYY